MFRKNRTVDCGDVPLSRRISGTTQLACDKRPFDREKGTRHLVEEISHGLPIAPDVRRARWIIMPEPGARKSSIYLCINREVPPVP